jgi:hypothetical protein
VIDEENDRAGTAWYREHLGIHTDYWAAARQIMLNAIELWEPAAD